MIVYSRSAEYAIRAFVYLADVPKGEFAMVKNIAADSDIPTHFLAKILQQLVRQGFLRSSKGPRGGFALSKPARDITLVQIIESIDGLAEYDRCPGGVAVCDDEAPCGMHDSWAKLRSRIMKYLEQTTIADIAKAKRQKQEALAKRAKRRRSPKKA